MPLPQYFLNLDCMYTRLYLYHVIVNVYFLIWNVHCAFIKMKRGIEKGYKKYDQKMKHEKKIKLHLENKK